MILPSEYPSRCSTNMVCDCDLSDHQQLQRGARRRRKRPRNSSTMASWPIFAMAVFALASSSCTYQSIFALASETAMLQPSKNDDTISASEEKNEEQNTRKPHRPIYGGRLKLVPTRKLVRVTSTTIHDENTTPWRKDEMRGKENESPTKVPIPESPTFWQKVSPFVKRGVLLAALTAVAVIDKKPHPILPAGTAMTTARATASWFPSLRFAWNKLWVLPGEILPSLSAALMIAWIPNLVLQKAYFELAFLFASLTSQPTLRNYLVTEIFPSLGGTVRKLFWSEFWKQAWDYLLEPFPHNVLLPTKQQQPVVHDTKWQAELSEFWSKRVVSRIDKWTASSVKALLQKNVQASVNELAEDTWKAAAYAWYPDDRNNKRFQQLEDTRRMIELECEDDDRNCIDGSNNHNDDAVEESTKDETPVQELAESSDNADADDDQELSSSSMVEIKEISTPDDETDMEESEAIPS
eukprot:CAMPEP_0116150736 /NCGR_PEP_ID=MMETSP0329-20121206/19716_1 /TAXON_ID=697910 /ORGANISM="Pseudo-nitzschia arenysensis, Strain B593" /LENGTH=466 /DNA_ID=CAMNT_0003647289 /DNA_START=160 /DNA_END=1560 /DNA_ORIENTATION=+